MEAVIFTGIQATGKSSFYRHRFFDTHIRINLDMLRTRHRERLLLHACLEAGQPFVVDNTNVTAKDRARYVAPAREAGFQVVGYYFYSSVGDALRRNGERTGRTRVPAKGLVGTHKRLEVPDPEEGFHLLYEVRIEAGEQFSVREFRTAGTG